LQRLKTLTSNMRREYTGWVCGFAGEINAVSRSGYSTTWVIPYECG